MTQDRPPHAVGKVDIVSASVEESFWDRVGRIRHEWGGLAYALLFARDC